jgi:hypothetical protein
MTLFTRRPVRRTFIPLLTLFVTAGIVGLSPVAQASSTSADLQIKGPGSAYTQADLSNHIVTLPASAGSAVSFAAKLVNTGGTTAQFKLFALEYDNQAISYTVAGASANGLIDQDAGYYTPPIAPGKSIAITIKITLNKATPPPFDQIWLLVTDSDDTTLIDQGYFAAILKAPSAATGPAQIFTKNGSSAYTGGPSNFVASTGPALAVNASTTFTAHVVNGATGADVVDLGISDECTNYLIDVKAGSTDVTDQVLGGTYRTPDLAVNGHLDLTVKVTYLGPRGGTTCDYDRLDVTGTSENFGVTSNQDLLVNPAV